MPPAMSNYATCGKPFPMAQRVLVSYLRHAQRIPNCCQERTLALAPVAEARARCRPRVAWAVLFMKAYALVAKEEPVLRSCLLTWPWLRLREAERSHAMVAVHRRHQDQDWLFFAKFIAPEEQTLPALQQRMDQFQQDDPAALFAKQLRYRNRPQWHTDLLFRLGMNLNPEGRLRRFGTFGLTSVAGLRSTIQNPPNILTSSITYGPVEADGRCRFTVVYDHRLMNGTQVAEIQERVQAAFDGPILDELRGLA